MAEWVHIYQGWANPEQHAAIEAIRRRVSLRRARSCVEMPREKRIDELVAVGFSQEEAAEIMDEITTTPPENT